MPSTFLQTSVVTAPSTLRRVIMAGPGTGKTYCLVERYRHLIEKENLDPIHQILVLSFSVAASHEISQRLKTWVEEGRCHESVLFAKVRTFDSFATWFMLNIDPETNLSGMSYDQRIEHAINILDNDPRAQEKMNQYRHIMVDEIQDLVGLRALLTQRILKCAGGGFTLFGDPAQGIYDFTMSETGAGPTSDQFIDWVEENFPDIDTNCTFENNFRADTNSALSQIADRGREMLLGSSANDAHCYLRNVYQNLRSCGAINRLELPADLVNNKTAILCRTNGQMLRLARELLGQGHRFVLRRKSEEKIVPRWVGQIFLGWPEPRIAKNDFLNRFEALIGNSFLLSPEEAWLLLKQAEGKKSERILDILSMRRGLGGSVIFPDDPAISQDPHRMVLSTIHRSKGREYRDVVVLMPDNASSEEILQEARVLYVGMTRAKRNLYSLSSQGDRGIRRINGTDRWVRSYNGRNLTGFEVGLADDFEPASFVSCVVFDGYEEDIRQNQEDLAEKVQPLAPASLELVEVRSRRPIYEIKIELEGNNVVMGRTSMEFGCSLVKILTEMRHRPPTGFPGKIGDLWVREVVTEIGDMGQTSIPREYRSTGLWLGLRIDGLGTCRDWE